MKNKIMIGMVSVLSLLATLTSCGGGTSSSSTQDKKIELLFWHTFGQGIIKSMEPLLEDFEQKVLEHDGVEIEVKFQYQGNYNDIAKKIAKGFPSGNSPTLAIAYPDHVADYLRSEQFPGQYVNNLDSFINDPEIGFGKEKWLGDDPIEGGVEDFVPAFIDEGRHYEREGTYSIPFMKSSEVMFYNKNALITTVSQYKPELKGNVNGIINYINSASWDEFMNLCGWIADNKESLKEDMPKLETPAFYDSDANMFISKMYQNDIPYSSIKDNKGQIDFESGKNLEKAKALVTTLKEHADKGRLTTKGKEGTYGSDNFKNQKSIFSIGSTGGTGYNLPTSGEFEVGVCKVPASNDKPLYVSQGPTFVLLNKTSLSESRNDLATKYGFKLIKYLTNPRNNVRICMTGSEGYVPVRISAYENAQYIDYLSSGDTLAEVANLVHTSINGYYINTPVFKGSAELRVQVGALITEVLTGKQTVDQAFTTAINAAKMKMN